MEEMLLDAIAYNHVVCWNINKRLKECSLEVWITRRRLCDQYKCQSSFEAQSGRVVQRRGERGGDLRPHLGLDTSQVEDMSYLFGGYQGYCSSYDTFNEDLSAWDVSSVTNMRGMFSETGAFNQPLNGWEPSVVMSCLPIYVFNLPSRWLGYRRDCHGSSSWKL